MTKKFMYIDTTSGDYKNITSTDVGGSANATKPVEVNTDGLVDNTLLGFYAVADGAINKGDLVYYTSEGKVSTLSDLTLSNDSCGVADATVIDGATVHILTHTMILKSILSGATQDTKYYWTGSAWSTSMPSGDNKHIWLAGISINATDAIIENKYLITL